MALRIDDVLGMVPITWFVLNENGADICACKNAGIEDDDEAFEYVKRANLYHEKFASGDRERIVMVSDRMNTAMKMSFMFADDDKKEASGKEGEVFVARFDMHSCGRAYRTFPEFDYALDGAVFYGAKDEEDIIKCMNAIVSCDLPFLSVVISRELLNSETVNKLLYDYPFVYIDTCGIDLDVELKLFTKSILESNRDAIGMTEVFPDTSDETIEELIESVKRIRGDAFKEEDILSMIEFRIREYMMDKYCDL